MHDAFAVSAPGLAPLIAAELESLGVEVRDVSPAGVTFPADMPTLLRVNLWSRLASRVVVRLADFVARDFATLEKHAGRVPWDRIIAPGVPVRFRVTCRKSRLYHSDAVAERVARALLRSVPSATVSERARGEADEDSEHTTDASSDDASGAPALVEQLVLVRFDHDQCVISADTSGALLHRRGWRQAIAKAPLRENLAAAMLTACNWSAHEPLVDPFCGSGTIGIEAALRARNMAPGLQRSFALEHWPGTDLAMVTTTRAAARAEMLPAAGVPIVLADRDAGACKASRANAERAGVTADVEIIERAVSDTVLDDIGQGGAVVTNPPYGQRISDGSDLRGLYSRVGDVLRVGGPAWRLGMLVPDKRYATHTGLRFDTTLRTNNGGIAVSVELSNPSTRKR